MDVLHVGYNIYIYITHTDTGDIKVKQGQWKKLVMGKMCENKSRYIANIGGHWNTLG